MGRKGNPNWEPKNKHKPLKIARKHATRITRAKSSFIPVPKSKKEQDKLADELILWARTRKDIHTTSDFALERGYYVKKFNGLAKENDYFSQALYQARLLILKRFRDEDKTWDKRTCYDYMMKREEWWDDEFKAFMHERRQKATDAQNESGIKTVYIERVSTDLKPRDTSED